MKAVVQAKLRPPRSFATLAVLFMGGGSFYTLPYLSAYFYIPMKDAMRLDNMQIGLMGSALGIASMIFYWPGGWIADRVAPRKLIAFSLIANGLLGFWLATFPSFRVLLTIQFLMGSGLRWTIILFSVILLAIGGVSWACLPEPAATGGTASNDRGEMSLLAAVSRVARIPAVWLTMFVILGAYATSVGSNYFTPYATDVYKQSVVFGGVLTLIGQSTGIFAPPFAGFVADRWTASRTILWLLVTLASCLLLFVIIPGGPRLLLLLFINSIAIGCVYFALRGIYFALLEEGAIPIALTGTATGLISLVAYTPDVFVPALAGHLLDSYAADGLGYRYFFLILALFAVGGVGFTLLFRYCVNGKPLNRRTAILASQ
jgi:sugar phosphate permease